MKELIPWIHQRLDKSIICAERWVANEGSCSVCGRINLRKRIEWADYSDPWIREMFEEWRRSR